MSCKIVISLLVGKKCISYDISNWLASDDQLCHDFIKSEYLTGYLFMVRTLIFSNVILY